MRPLIFSLSLFFCLNVFAEAPSAKITTSISAESGDAGLTTQSSAAASSTTVSVDASTGSLYSKVTYRLGVDQIDANYDRYLITAKNGTITPLSDTYDTPQTVARAGVDFYVKDFSFSVDGSQTASTTPFSGYTGKFVAAYTSYTYGAKYSAEILRADHDLPLSYFVNPDNFQTELRPERNLEDREALSWEQILSDRTKSKLEVFAAQRPESRPPHVGAEASLGYALSDLTSIVGKLGLAHEIRGAILYDDTGYFDATWAQLEYRLQPNYHWSLAGIFDTILETETARGALPEQKIGTDTIAIEARTRGKNWELGAKTLGAFSNTGYHDFQVGADLSWQI